MIKNKKMNIMKIKPGKLLLMIGAFIAGAVIFNGCSDHSLSPQPSFKAHITGMVYMPQAQSIPSEHSAAFGFGFDTTEVISYSAVFKGPKKRSQDISVSFIVDPALVDSFNTNNLTSYPLLPDSSYELSSSADIPTGETSTGELKLKLKGNIKVPHKQYLLPVTVKVTRGDVPVNTDLQTTYFLITAHKVRIVAKDHNYNTVFADDALNPHYLYFIGTPKHQKQAMVWKYDLKGDSLATGFPKKLTKVFKLPYPQKISKIHSVVWQKFTQYTPAFQSYFFGNGYYYRYNIKTQKAGALHPITDFSRSPDNTWPPKHFPKRIDCGFYEHKRDANYLFNDYYEKVHLGPLRAWFYPFTGHDLPGPWKAIPQSFVDRGFNGAYYDLSSKTVHFFSGNEFVIMNAGNLQRIGDIKKITNSYTGL
jgi:hypothetical protein